MPHEKVWDKTNTPDDNANRVEVDWRASPDGYGEGFVQLIVERPEIPARMAGSIEHAERELTRRLDGGGAAWVQLVDRLDMPRANIVALLMDALGGELVYGFGTPSTRMGIQLDRDGCNRVIRAVRKGRDTAYGKDE